MDGTPALPDALYQLVDAGRHLVAKGLVSGPGGNLSVREGDRVYLSPSGYSLADARAEDYAVVNLVDGRRLSQGPRPTSETAMHLAIYRRRPEITAVVHTHPVHCVAVASALDRLPPLFPDQVALIGEIAWVPYILPTTEPMAQAVADAVADHQAVLLQNHGAVTVGRTVREALFRTEVLEDAARIYLLGHLVGKPRVLTSDEVDAIRQLESEKYRTRLLGS